MSGGGGGGNTTTVQKSDPWVGQQNYLKDIYARAQNLPQRQYYPGQTVTPFGQATTDSLNALYARGAQGSEYDRLAGTSLYDLAGASGQLGMGFASDPTAGAMGQLYGSTQGPNSWQQQYANRVTPLFNQMQAAGPGSGASMGMLGNTLASTQGDQSWQNQYARVVTPYIDTMQAMPLGGQEAINTLGQQAQTSVLGNPWERWRDISSDITGQVNQAAAAQGRLGSGAWAGNLGEQLGQEWRQYASERESRDLQQRALQQQAAQAQGGLSQNQFMQEIARQQAKEDMVRASAQMGFQNQALQADIASRIGQMGQTDFAQNIDRQLASAGLVEKSAQMGFQNQELQQALLGQISGADLARTQAGMEGYRNLGVLGPALAQQDWTNIQNRLAASQAYEQKANEYLQADIDRWNFAQQEPYDRLSAYSQLVQQGFPGGQMTSTGPNPNQRSMLGGALGGAATGAGLASGLMGAGAINAWNPWGWGLMGAGALLGALG